MIDLEERNKQIIKMRKNGHTFAEVAKRFGLSKERVHQICTRDKAKKERKERIGDFWELSTRVSNLLLRNNIRTKKHLIQLLESANGAGIRIGIGNKGIEEIQNYVGFDIVSKKIKVQGIRCGKPYENSITVLKRRY